MINFLFFITFITSVKILHDIRNYNFLNKIKVFIKSYKELIYSGTKILSMQSEIDKILYLGINLFIRIFLLILPYFLMLFYLKFYGIDPKIYLLLSYLPYLILLKKFK